MLPILVLLLFGIIEFGMAYNAQLNLTLAAREGARMAAVGTFSASTVKARAYPLPAASITIVGPTLVTDASGDYYQVKVSYPYQLTIPLWGDQSLTLSSTAKMRKE